MPKPANPSCGGMARMVKPSRSKQIWWRAETAWTLDTVFWPVWLPCKYSWLLLSWVVSKYPVPIAWGVATIVSLAVVYNNSPMFKCVLSAIFGEVACEQATLSPSEILRNLAVFFAAVIGFPLLVWRGWVADRQARTAEGALLHDRRQAAIKNLANDDKAIRDVGAKEMRKLDSEDETGYHGKT